MPQVQNQGSRKVRMKVFGRVYMLEAGKILDVPSDKSMRLLMKQAAQVNKLNPGVKIVEYVQGRVTEEEIAARASESARRQASEEFAAEVASLKAELADRSSLLDEALVELRRSRKELSARPEAPPKPLALPEVEDTAPEPEPVPVLTASKPQRKVPKRRKG